MIKDIANMKMPPVKSRVGILKEGGVPGLLDRQWITAIEILHCDGSLNVVTSTSRQQKRDRTET